MAKKNKVYSEAGIKEAFEKFTGSKDEAEQRAALRRWFVADLELQRKAMELIGIPTEDLDKALDNVKEWV